jgi:hypothetical protein
MEIRKKGNMRNLKEIYGFFVTNDLFSYLTIEGENEKPLKRRNMRNLTEFFGITCNV